MPADPHEHAEYQRRNEEEMAELRAIVARARARGGPLQRLRELVAELREEFGDESREQWLTAEEEWEAFLDAHPELDGLGGDDAR
jgi:hypothetical protein